MLLAFNPFQVNVLLMKKSGTWFLQAKSMKNKNVTLPQVFFQLFVSKSQPTGFSISGTFT